MTVTVGQDTTTTSKALQNFVDKVNSLFDGVSQATAYDSDKKQASILTGDSSVQGIATTLRGLIGNRAFGASGKYQSLADLGISTGQVGSAVGSTNHLVRTRRN